MFLFYRGEQRAKERAKRMGITEAQLEAMREFPSGNKKTFWERFIESEEKQTP